VERTGCRRLWALIAGLPPDSALRRRGKQWTTAHELAARQVESTVDYLRVIARANGVKFKGPAPPPVEHPDRPSAAPVDAPVQMSTREEIAGFLGRLRG
jgi:hypothetical protein